MLQKVQRIAGQNEAGTILLLLIIAVWFFTSKRFTKFKEVLMSPFKMLPSPVAYPPVVQTPEEGEEPT